MSSYQINYQRRDIEGQVIKGSVIHRARHVSEAIDYAIAELDADDDTVSYVILKAEVVH